MQIYFFCLAEILFSNRQKDQSANANHFFNQNTNANNFFSQKHVSPIRMSNNNNPINNNNFLQEKQMHFYQNSAPPNIFAASNFQNFKINNERTQIEEEPQVFFQNNNNKPQSQPQPQTFFQNNFFVAPGGQNNNQIDRNNSETTNTNMNVMNNVNPNNTNTNINNFNAIPNGENLIINRNQIFPPEDQEKGEKHFGENSFLRRQNEGDDQSINFLKLTARANDDEDDEYDKSSPVFNQANANFLTFSERAPPMMNYNVPGNY